MIWRLVIVFVSIGIGALFFLRYRENRRLRYLLLSLSWVLVNTTFILDPVPPIEITDTTQWQYFWVAGELTVRAVLFLLTLVTLMFFRGS